MPRSPQKGDARFIIDMANHLNRLKRRAAPLLQSLRATRRGYFTPTEEEHVRQLLISYWQSRAALMELILAMETQARSAHGYSPTKPFILAYAGALVLLNAAHFLYRAVDDLPLVRSKLNEPDPAFGIPRNVYNTIQDSLTDPQNAWRIHQANHVYFFHRAEFKTLTHADPALKPMIRLIDRLRLQLPMNKREYAKTFLSVRARQMMESIQEKAITEVIYDLQESVSRLISGISTQPNHHPALPPLIQAAFLKRLQPGDVLVTRKEYALTNYFLPGYWPHAALYLGKVNGEPSVLEALKDGVHVRSISSPFGSDALALIRPRLSAIQIKKAIQRGLKHAGKPYDFDFDFTRSDRLVCTEVIYRAYEGPIRFELVNRAGRKTLAAEDLLRMALARKCFDPVAAYCRDCGEKLEEGEKVKEVLKKTMGGNKAF